MRKNFRYLLILHIVLALYSFLGIFFKFASGEDPLSLKFVFCYGIVLTGLFMYAIVWQQLLKKLSLIVAYANKAVTVVWGIVWGFLFFDEPVNIKKIIAALVIVFGVYIVVTSDYEETDDGLTKEDSND